MLLKLNCEFKRIGIRNIIITLHSHGTLEPQFAQHGIEIIHWSFWNPLDYIKGFFKLTRLTFGKPTILQGWMYHGNIFATFLSLIFRHPLFHNIRQSMASFHRLDLRSRLAMRFNGWLSHFATKTVYPSHLAIRHHQGRLHYAHNDQLIPNGFPTSQIDESRSLRASCRDALSIREDQIMILNVARFDPDKDQLTFLDAAKLLLKEYPNVVFVLVGRGISYQNQQIAAVLPDPLRLSFRLVDEVRDTKPYYEACDIFALTSIAEAFPNVLGEALMGGAICVSTNVGDAAVILKDVGFIVEPKDIVSLASTWKHIINLSDQEKTQVVEQGYLRMRTQYSIEAVARQYLNVYGYSP